MKNDKKKKVATELRVYVIGGGYEYIRMFADFGMKGARSVKDADFLCFTGGEDVDPELYGEKALNGTYFNRERDNFEAGLFGEAMGLSKPMVGICRGGQFLNVLNGGTLWQDINNHANGRRHDVKLTESGLIVKDMTSTHHQQMIPGKGAVILATAALATIKSSYDRTEHRPVPKDDDYEVLWYPESLSLCFQPHPEMAGGAGPCRDLFLDFLDDLVIPAC